MLLLDHIQNRITSRFAVMPFRLIIKHKSQQTPEQTVFWEIKLQFDPTHHLTPEVKNALRHLVCGFFTEDEGVMVD